MDAEDRRRLALFVERMRTMHEGPPYTTSQSQKESPRLQLVTADNAGEFQGAPRERGRRPKVATGGNVVAFERLAPAAAADLVTARRCLASSRYLERMRAASQPTGSPAALPPAPADPLLYRRADMIASSASLTATLNSRDVRGEFVSCECFIAAAWARLGFAPPHLTAKQRAMQRPIPEPL